MNDAYNAALQVVDHFGDTWERVECCENGRYTSYRYNYAKNT